MTSGSKPSQKTRHSGSQGQDSRYNVVGEADPPEPEERPVEIVHAVDEVRNRGRVEARYNFLEYHFRSGSAEAVARAYLDDLKKVTVSFHALDQTDAHRSFADGVHRFLSRRFRRVDNS